MAQERGSAWLVAALLVAVMHVATVEAVTWTVGGSSGWTLAYDYTTWASGKTFKTGDILFFPYTQAEHNVVEVPKSSYDSCSSTGALSSDSAGNTNVTLKTAGTHYYICSVIGHCSAGMKLAVKVVSAAGAAAPAPAKSPTPSPPATSPAPAPGSVPSEAPASSPSTGTPSTAPTPGSASPTASSPPSPPPSASSPSSSNSSAPAPSSAVPAAAFSGLVPLIGAAILGVVL